MTAEQTEFIRTLETSRGKLDPAQLIEAARDENSPLHSCFEWDDSAAAAQWRMEQARELIRRVRIEVTVEETTIRTVQYVRDVDAPADQAGYANIMRIRKPQAVDVVAAEWSAVYAHAKRAHSITVAKADDLPNGSKAVHTAESILEQIETLTK